MGRPAKSPDGGVAGADVLEQTRLPVLKGADYNRSPGSH